MKKNQILKVALMLTILFCVNKSFGQTTQEEYNYITKGYKVQVESGLDMKKGYSLTDLGKWSIPTGTVVRQCEFKALIKTGQIKPSAIMMIYNRTDNGTKFYICIPSSDASNEIWNQTLDFIKTTFKENDSMLQVVIWALMKFSSQEVAK